MPIYKVWIGLEEYNKKTDTHTEHDLEFSGTYITPDERKGRKFATMLHKIGILISEECKMTFL